MVKLDELTTAEDRRNMAIEKLIKFCDQVEANKGEFNETECAKLQVAMLRMEGAEEAREVLMGLPKQYKYAKSICMDLVGMALSSYDMEKKDEMAENIQKENLLSPYEGTEDEMDRSIPSNDSYMDKRKEQNLPPYEGTEEEIDVKVDNIRPEKNNNKVKNHIKEDDFFIGM